MLLSNPPWITEEIKKYLEINDNKSMMIQNLWDAAKMALRGMFIAIKSYLRKQNHLILHLKQLEKEEQTKSKVSRRKEIRKMRAEIEMKTIEKTNEPKSWFSLTKINKIDKTYQTHQKKMKEG